MGKKTSRLTKPRDNPLLQQKLPAWTPVLAPHWVILFFIVIFLVFTPIGILLIFASESVKEVSVQYTDRCEMTRNNTVGGAPYCEIQRLEFTLKEKMSEPVYMYYKLSNFYQNHRRYAASKSDEQLSGDHISLSSASSKCSGMYAYGTDPKNQTYVYNPCGLIAWSMFNDTISLYKVIDDYGNTSLICSGDRPLGDPDFAPHPDTKCTKKGIAWSSDRSVKFKRPDNETDGNLMWPNHYYNEEGHLIPRHDDEDFMVWMRTAALPNFRKLYRIIKTDLEPGTYYFYIHNRYPVTDFGGKKSVVLSTTSLLGGQNLFLAISYVSVGGICLLLAAAFLVGWIIQLLISKARRQRI